MKQPRAGIPQALSISWIHPYPKAGLSYLKRESLISYNGRFGPVDDFREGQLPARAEQHRDAASLRVKRASLESPLHMFPKFQAINHYLGAMGKADIAWGW